MRQVRYIVISLQHFFSGSKCGFDVTPIQDQVAVSVGGAHELAAVLIGIVPGVRTVIPFDFERCLPLLGSQVLSASTATPPSGL